MPVKSETQLLEEDLEVLSHQDLVVLHWKLSWKARARVKQLPPHSFVLHPEKTAIWGLRSGRGFGKTLTAAEWISQAAWDDPGSINHVIAPTYDDVRYICFEGPTGLYSIIPDELIDWKNCNKSLPSIALKNGSTFRGFAADTPDRLRGPQCLVANTLITMGDGSTKRITEVQIGEYVQTRIGLRRVLDSWLARENSPVYELRTVHGPVIRGTIDHPIYVRGLGWVPLGKLKPGQVLLSYMTGGFTDANAPAITSGYIEWVPDPKVNEFGSTYIEPSTRKRWDQFLQVISSITRTIIESTIGKIISKLLPAQSTPHIIEKGKFNPPNRSGWLKNVFRKLGRFSQLKPLSVISANGNSSRGRWEDLPDSSVANTVETSGEVPTFRVLDVRKLVTLENVYDLQIEEAEEFYANGILVHNCHRIWAEEIASWKYPKEAWSNMEFGLRLGNAPQICWTSTPRPTAFMKERNNDKRAIVVTGSTYENRANLTPIFYENVAKYEGTQIGRQELHGEILDPEEAGLVKRSQWRLWPVNQPLPKFLFIVFSLDTAFTEKTFDKKEQKADPTAASVWGCFEHEGVKNAMLLDCWEDYLGFPDLVKRVKKEREITYGDSDEPLLTTYLRGAAKPRHQGRPPDLLLIEDKGSGISLRQSLALENILTESYNPGQLDKLSRLHIVSPMFAHRRVWVVESSVSPGEPRNWADPLISQVCTYVGEGSVEHDDLLDTTTQALRLIMDKFFDPFTVVIDAEEVRKQQLLRRRSKPKRSNPYE